jgi:molecular chaperone GrpE
MAGVHPSAIPAQAGIQRSGMPCRAGFSLERRGFASRINQLHWWDLHKSRIAKKGELMDIKERETTPESQAEEAAGAEEMDDDADVTTAEARVEDEVPQAEVEAEPEPQSLEDQLARLQEERDSYLDGLQRSRAELDNYRKRATQEKLQAASRGKADLLQALLPILGNMRLALQHADQDADAVRQGIQMIWQQFEGFMRDQGIEPVATIGEPFDPARHEALSTAPATDDHPPDTIVTEIKAGYLFEGRLLSPAQVVVARAVEADNAAKQEVADANRR